jgi:hypothetical protein
MNRSSVRDVIRRKLDGGTLPTEPPPDKIYAGDGSGAACDARGEPIRAGSTVAVITTGRRVRLSRKRANQSRRSVRAGNCADGAKRLSALTI